MKYLLLIVPLFFGDSRSWNQTESPNHIPYTIAKPDLSFELNEELLEISGLTDFSEDRLACIQDEKGQIYILESKSGKVVGNYKFAEDGDYEGITRVGKILYVLRSDGVLFEISNLTGNVETKSYQTGIPAKNNEGLCYDPFNNRLLIGSKSKPGKGSQFTNIRQIYSFDIKSKRTSKDPIYEFRVSCFQEYAESNAIDLNVKKSKKGGKDKPVLRLGISAIAVHPRSAQLYVLSAIDQLLIVIQADGTINSMYKLDNDLPQAEGITFMNNADMVVSTEGKNTKPMIHHYKYLND